MCVLSGFSVYVCVCVTCPVQEVLPGLDEGQDVRISLLVSGQWNGGGELGGGQGPENVQFLA